MDSAGIEDEEVGALLVDESGDEDVAAVDVDLGPALVRGGDDGPFVAGRGERNHRKRAEAYGLIWTVDVDEVVAEKIEADEAICVCQGSGGDHADGTVPY